MTIKSVNCGATVGRVLPDIAANAEERRLNLFVVFRAATYAFSLAVGTSGTVPYCVQPRCFLV